MGPRDLICSVLSIKMPPGAAVDYTDIIRLSPQANGFGDLAVLVRLLLDELTELFG